MGIRKSVGGIATVAVLGLALPVTAGYVEIGGGWAAEWDDTLDPFVQITSDGVGEDAVFIEKTAEYRPGVFTVAIVFRQIAWPAVSNIVINDEILTNNSGFDWTGFEMELVDGPDARFDPERTANSGGGGPIGFSINPFTEAEFVDDDRRLLIGGGTVENGDVWFPGDGADDGQLWINVNPHPEKPFTNFVLKETPLPGPGGLALLALGLLGSRRRRS